MQQIAELKTLSVNSKISTNREVERLKKLTNILPLHKCVYNIVFTQYKYEQSYQSFYS